MYVFFRGWGRVSIFISQIRPARAVLVFFRFEMKILDTAKKYIHALSPVNEYANYRCHPDDREPGRGVETFEILANTSRAAMKWRSRNLSVSWKLFHLEQKFPLCTWRP